MLRVLIISVALLGLGCNRGESPTTPAVADQGSYSLASSSADDLGDADDGGRLHSDDIRFSMVVRHIHVRVRECDAQDGHYIEFRSTWTGSARGDPRFSGTFVVDEIQDMINADKLNGPIVANVEIRDESGRKKADGVFNGWGDDVSVQGTIVGTVRDAGGLAGGKFVANAVQISPNGGLVLQAGGDAPTTRLPAGTWRSGCNGVKFRQFDVDLPDPGSAGLAASASRNAGRLRFVRP